MTIHIYIIIRQYCIILKVIPISDKEHNHEKEVEDRLRKEITEDLKKKKLGLRRKAGLILSGIGGIMYLLSGIILLITPLWHYFVGAFSIPYLITGAISLMGIIILKGLEKIKIGGTVILISIPISIVITLISIDYTNTYFFFDLITRLGYLLITIYPLPFPSSVFVIIGGILCLLSSNKESSERENSIKIAV